MFRPPTRQSWSVPRPSLTKNRSQNSSRNSAASAFPTRVLRIDAHGTHQPDQKAGP
jgi:hypothetical protein